MRLDEAGQDLEIAVEELPIEPDLMPERRNPRAGLSSWVESVVLHDAVVADQLLAKHVDQLGLGVPAVRAERLEERNVRRGERRPPGARGAPRGGGSRAGSPG